jgi:hypothetical protein
VWCRCSPASGCFANELTGDNWVDVMGREKFLKVPRLRARAVVCAYVAVVGSARHDVSVPLLRGEGRGSAGTHGRLQQLHGVSDGLRTANDAFWVRLGVAQFVAGAVHWRTVRWCAQRERQRVCVRARLMCACAKAFTAHSSLGPMPVCTFSLGTRRLVHRRLDCPT